MVWKAIHENSQRTLSMLGGFGFGGLPDQCIAQLLTAHHIKPNHYAMVTTSIARNPAPFLPQGRTSYAALWLAAIHLLSSTLGTVNVQSTVTRNVEPFKHLPQALTISV